MFKHQIFFLRVLLIIPAEFYRLCVKGLCFSKYLNPDTLISEDIIV